jgi:hypothetical protein
MNYLLVGWWPNTLDQFYVTSWKVLPVVLIIFDVIVSYDPPMTATSNYSQSPIAYCILRWRLNQKPLLESALQVIMWTPLLVIFFGGLSFHLSKALLCHFVGINIEWTATAKELETTGFFIGMDRVVKDFKYMYITMLLIMGGMI